MAKMERHLDQELSSLKARICEMGADVEKAIEHAVQGVIHRSPTSFEQVMLHENRINKFHCSIDEACMYILARQAPMASALRLVLGCIKINSDLERMGDQAVNITHCGRHALAHPNEAAASMLLPELAPMAEAVRAMTRDALDAFLRQDQELARQVVLQDDAVDDYKRSIFRQVTEIMKANPEQVDRGMDLILISRNLERIGDHATNIAEDVIFVASGVDIRHPATRSVG